MAIGNKVVVKFQDGSLLKGYATDFYKSRPFFHLVTTDSEQPIVVKVDDLKALFFVKTFEGRKGVRRKLKHVPFSVPYGRKARVVFRDGEEIEGCVQSYKREERIFMIEPIHPTGNNLRIFCNKTAIHKIIWLADEARAKWVNPIDYVE